MNRLPAALAYAALGMRVFPQDEDKRPCIKSWPTRASADPEVVRSFWFRFPSANVAICTGLGSGVIALDVDVRPTRDGPGSLAALEAEHGPVPLTWSWRTPSGGRGFLFAHPGKALPNRHDFRPGLELRAEGVAVTLPPSSRCGQPYVWLGPPSRTPLADPPSWLLAAAIPPPSPAPGIRPRVHIRAPGARAVYIAAAIERECVAVANEGPGGRNSRLFLAALRLGSFVGAGMLASETAAACLETAARDCGLIADDGLRAVQATIASGLKRGAAQPREFGR